MRGNFSCLFTNSAVVHLEPEADKKRFTEDVAEWILERAKLNPEQGMETQSKL